MVTYYNWLIGENCIIIIVKCMCSYDIIFAYFRFRSNELWRRNRENMARQYTVYRE